MPPSCAPSSVPLTVDGCTVSQAPVFVARLSRRVSSNGALAMDVSSDAIALATFWRRTAALPSRRQAAWSAVRNRTWPLSADTRCPVLTQDACQFSGAVRVGSGRAIPACLTGQRVISLPGAPSPTPSNSAGRNAFVISSSTGLNALLIPGVTRCTNAHFGEPHWVNHVHKFGVQIELGFCGLVDK